MADYPKTAADFSDQFPDEDSCWRYLEKSDGQPVLNVLSVGTKGHVSLKVGCCFAEAVTGRCRCSPAPSFTIPAYL